MVRMASQRRVEAPPGFEPGWRFRRPSPVASRRSLARMIAPELAGVQPDAPIVSHRRSCVALAEIGRLRHRGHSSGTAQREAAGAARLPIPIEVPPQGSRVSPGAPAVRMPQARQVTGTEWRQKTSSGRSPTRRTVGWTVNE